MTNQEFFEIVACFDRSTAQTMKLSTQEFTIELTRGGASAPAASAPAAAPVRLYRKPSEEKVLLLLW